MLASAGPLWCPAQLMHIDAPAVGGEWHGWKSGQCEHFDINRFLSDPHDVEDPDQLRILVEVETQDATARPEHALTEARIISRRPDHRIPGLPG
jgi:hypothetical protein